MKFSREMKAYFRESFGYTTEPERAASYLYNLFVEEAWKDKDYDEGDKPDWSIMFNSKQYKDMLAAFQWCDERWGGHSVADFKIEIDEVCLWKVS